MSIRRTKIICTIGPASESEETIAALVEAGMDVARLNFSHGDHAWHGAVIERIRRVGRRSDRPLAILQDLGGPKIRVAEMSAPELHLVTGDEISVLRRSRPSAGPWLVLTSEVDPGMFAEGDRLLVSDGTVALRVAESHPDGVLCRVHRGGVVRARAGVNLPDTRLTVPSLTERDLADLEFGVSRGVDWIALSFVQKAQDILDLKLRLREMGADIPVIAKIEKPQALENLGAILDASDGAMVARGDLGVEVEIENVPLIQKRILSECLQRSIPGITATQMLESMTRSAVPTRAEVADIANAIMDGTDAVMLSAETSIGEHAVAACAAAERICQRIDEGDWERAREVRTTAARPSDAVADAAAGIADRLSASAIIACTLSGSTARMMSSRRSAVQILAATSSPEASRQLALVWGVHPALVPTSDSTDTVIADAIRAARGAGLVVGGAMFVITAGHPPGTRGQTNLIQVGIG
ncbi:MAG: pyruvate kinase [Pseudomonadota bacterium]